MFLQFLSIVKIILLTMSNLSSQVGWHAPTGHHEFKEWLEAQEGLSFKEFKIGINDEEYDGKLIKLCNGGSHVACSFLATLRGDFELLEKGCNLNSSFACYILAGELKETGKKEDLDRISKLRHKVCYMNVNKDKYLLSAKTKNESLYNKVLSIHRESIAKACQNIYDNFKGSEVEKLALGCRYNMLIDRHKRYQDDCLQLMRKSYRNKTRFKRDYKKVYEFVCKSKKEVKSECYQFSYLFDENLAMSKVAKMDKEEVARFFSKNRYGEKFDVCIKEPCHLNHLDYYKMLDLQRENKLEKLEPFYKYACNQGDPTACFNLGIMHLSQDGNRAYSSFKKGCKSGSEDSCHNYTILTSKESSKSKLYKSFCDIGFLSICKIIGSKWPGFPKEQIETDLILTKKKIIYNEKILETNNLPRLCNFEIDFHIGNYAYNKRKRQPIRKTLENRMSSKACIVEVKKIGKTFDCEKRFDEGYQIKSIYVISRKSVHSNKEKIEIKKCERIEKTKQLKKQYTDWTKKTLQKYRQATVQDAMRESYIDENHIAAFRDELFKNKEFLIKLFNDTKSLKLWNYVPVSFLNNEEFMLATKSKHAYKYASPELREKKKFAINFLQNYDIFPDKLREDADIAFKALIENPNLFSELPEVFRADLKFANILVKCIQQKKRSPGRCDYHKLKFLGPELKKNAELYLKVINIKPAAKNRGASFFDKSVKSRYIEMGNETIQRNRNLTKKEILKYHVTSLSAEEIPIEFLEDKEFLFVLIQRFSKSSTSLYHLARIIGNILAYVPLSLYLDRDFVNKLIQALQGEAGNISITKGSIQKIFAGVPREVRVSVDLYTSLPHSFQNGLPMPHSLYKNPVKIRTFLADGRLAFRAVPRYWAESQNFLKLTPKLTGREKTTKLELERSRLINQYFPQERIDKIQMQSKKMSRVRKKQDRCRIQGSYDLKRINGKTNFGNDILTGKLSHIKSKIDCKKNAAIELKKEGYTCGSPIKRKATEMVKRGDYRAYFVGAYIRWTDIVTRADGSIYHKQIQVDRVECPRVGAKYGTSAEEENAFILDMMKIAEFGKSKKEFLKELSTDGELLTRLVKNEKFHKAFYYANDNLKNDQAFILKLLNYNPKIFRYFNEKLYSDVNFIVRAIGVMNVAHPPHKTQGISRYIPKEIVLHKRVFEKLLKIDSFAVSYVNKDNMKKRGFAKKIASINGTAFFRFVASESPMFYLDRDLVKIALKSSQPEYWNIARSKHYKNDLELAKISIEAFPENIGYASTQIQRNPEIIKIALGKEYKLLKNKLNNLYLDKNIIHKLYSKGHYWIVKNIDNELKDNYSFMEKLVRIKAEYACKWASNRLRKSGNFLLSCFRYAKNLSFIERIPTGLYDDLEFARNAIKEKKILLEFFSPRVIKEIKRGR